MTKLEYSRFRFAQGIDHHGSMNCNAKIVDRFLDAQAYSSFGFLPQLDQSIDFTVSKRASQVYPVPLDPGNLPALDLRVVKWQVATPSHVRPSRVPGKVDTPKPRLLRSAYACPDEIKFGQHLSKNLSSSSPLPHFRPALIKAGTGQNHRKTARYSVGSQGRHPHAPDFNSVPFPPTTLPSRAITFKGFLIILTLPREEVVTVRGPIHRAQPPFHLFLLYRVPFFLPNFLSLFRACPGFGTFVAVHERLDSPLRSPTSPILHCAVVGASVPTPFSPSCRCCHLTGPVTRSAQAESCDSQSHFPDSFPLASRLGNVSL
ncbi:hypothetical protein CRG98_011982 [Punica granatum]|uniref:Uncharacterized protein n=1 Tax=Punica granatum TaxID=22663 RepID=A0A2I0KIK0_PUNGR|nr:hypothetical protein CRG98_011982 [Punica granatum]